ncbi:MAG: AbrB/MazE/SpoVT family DNA-binding domain-containing protein [Thaumarchaeota archaeon]|nr:AbrB/MazE/SpoVT family DNA-binding domain-containing protein [Nitrososphaerota archaeon]
MADEPIIEMTRVSDKGQVVIPKEIRDKLKFTEGSKLLVIATGDAVVLQRIESVAGKMKMKDILERVRSITGRISLG